MGPETDYGLGFAQGQYDEQEPPTGKVVGTCAYCGREIHEGEKIYRLDGDIYCGNCVTEDEANGDGLPDEY